LSTRTNHHICVLIVASFNLVNTCEANTWQDEKKIEVEFDDGVEDEGFKKVLWCHSSTSLPSKSKTCFGFLLRVFYFIFGKNVFISKG
jgi:hypothetical protein